MAAGVAVNGSPCTTSCLRTPRRVTLCSTTSSLAASVSYFAISLTTGQGHFIPPIFSPGLEDMGPFDKSKPDYIPGILTRFRARLPWGQTLKPRQRRKKGATS